MIIEQLNKHWEVIDGEKGAEIEYNCGEGKWFAIDNPTWLDDYECRIKSKLELVPFDFSDAEFLIGKVIKHKTTNSLDIINTVSVVGMFAYSTMSYEGLLEYYTFLDGSPCGKLK